MTKRMIMCAGFGAVLTLATLHILLWQSAWIGVTAGIFWLIGLAFLAGSLFGGKELSERLPLGLLVVTTLIILTGGSSFYLARFTDFHIALMILFIPVALLWIDWHRNESVVKEWLAQGGTKARRHEGKLTLKRILHWFHENWFSLVLVAAYVGLYSFAIITILNNQTAEAIRSPWEAMPRTILLVYFLATVILFLLFHISGRRENRVSKNNTHSAKVDLWETLRRLLWHGSASKADSGAEVEHAPSLDGAMRVSPKDNLSEMRVPQKEMEASPVLSFLLCLHFFLSFSLALLVYSIGFGFDPFIHRTTESMLADTGTIIPKPYLYVGQYTLVVFLTKLFALPLVLVDKWLLPVLASLLLPSLLIYCFRKTFPVRAISDRPYHFYLTTLTLLILPVYFIATIPQPFANLLYLILIFLSFPYLSGRHAPLSLLWGLGIALFLVHALTGIPALLYLFLLTILSRPAFRFRKSIMLFAPLLGTVAIPGLVAIGNVVNGNGHQASASLVPYPALLPQYLPFLSLAHTAELWQRALPILFLIAVLTGTALLWKHGRRGLTIVPWLTALSLAASYFLVRNVNLSAIIAYERAEFTERILELIGITLLPFFTYSLLYLWRGKIGTIFAARTVRASPDELGQIRSGGESGRSEGGEFRNKKIDPKHALFSHGLITSIIISCLITVSFYYAYPRVDAFAKSRGYSVSQSDIDAVRWIEKDAAGAPYIVLANQSVSAAALQEFGFKQYFTATNCPLTTNHCKLFYYPIPTSSPLYQYYLDMVYKEAARETMLKAMELTGVNRAYFVLNSYWLDAEKIAARAVRDATSLQRFDGEVVFMYTK